MSRILCICLFVAVCAAQTAAANWGHWRGDSGNGVSHTAKPPTNWSETRNVRWKVAVPGRSSGSPVIWGDRIFVVSAVKDPVTSAGSSTSLQFTVMCFARSSGDLVWKQVAIEARPHEGTHRTNGFASASPCTDGAHVYAHFGSRGLYCYTMDGEFVWSRNFGDMTTRAGFGEGSSPTLINDKILVPWDHEGQSYLFALNKATGETIWQVERDEPSCWATPFMFQTGGRTQVVMNGQNYARSYALETGQELWRCGGQTQRPVASAVGNARLVFVGSGFRGSFLGAFTAKGKGDITGTSAVTWNVNRDTPDIASPLLSGNRLYYYKGKSGLITCVDASTGSPHFSTQRVGLNTIYSSPVAAGGHVYLTDRSGKTVVIEDAPRLKIVATNSVGETVDATLAPVDNELFIRGEKHLFCIAEAN